MTRIITNKAAAFEQAFQAISLATWNRPRTTNELRSFLDRRQEAIDFAE